MASQCTTCHYKAIHVINIHPAVSQLFVTRMENEKKKNRNFLHSKMLAYLGSAEVIFDYL